MTNFVTRFADIQLPENWAKYMAVNSTVKTALWTSGAVVNVPGINITEGGAKINMPFWNDVSGSPDVLDEANELQTNKVSSGKQLAVVNNRGKAFSVNELAAGYAGSDILGHISGRLSQFWNRGFQGHMLSTLKGITAASSMSASVLDLTTDANASTSAQTFSPNSFIDAAHLLGDNRQVLSTIVCHSDVVAAMEKLDLLDKNIQPSLPNPLPSYRGKPIIELDSIAPVTLSGGRKAYTLYFIGAGAFGYGEGEALNTTETFRNITKGDTILTTRRSYVLHPMGVSYTGALPTDSTTPLDTDYATAANHTLVVDHKLVPIAKFVFLLPA